MLEIKFRKYYVTTGDIKSRVSYHMDGRIDKRKCVCLYAKDYDRSLGKVFKGEYVNDSDMMTDYFDMGHVYLFEDSPHYTEARKVAEGIHSQREQRRLLNATYKECEARN